MSSLPCPRCGGTEVIPDAEVRDYDASSWRALEVNVALANPQPASFLGMAGTRTHQSGTVRARVCGTCGHVELYSPEAAALWSAYSGGGVIT